MTSLTHDGANHTHLQSPTVFDGLPADSAEHDLVTKYRGAIGSINEKLDTDPNRKTDGDQVILGHRQGCSDRHMKRLLMALGGLIALAVVL